jgi:hypothetical protein
MGSWYTVVQTPTTCTNELDLRLLIACQFGFVIILPKKKKKEYELEAPPTTFYILEKMNGWIIVHVCPQF